MLTPAFGAFVAAAHAAGRLVVQPRMGFSQPDRMRAGLRAVRDAAATTVGTLTIDSYTRVGALGHAANAVAAGVDLNGYPIATHDLDTTRAVLAGVPGFPVQVRHGSSVPEPIVRALVAAGLGATEGGPVSYCLPYGRTPLHESVDNWTRACEPLLALRDSGTEPHIETFGGCMMGQLCPPSLLVALSVLEGMFFRQCGLRSLSLSYAQQTSFTQDVEAIDALRALAGEYLDDVELHLVLYAYMGVYPKTPHGALALLGQAARLATTAGCARLIVKTAAEAHRIPTVEENVAALEHAATISGTPAGPHPVTDTGIFAEATALVHAVLELGDDVGTALRTAFARGVLDVPYCLHPDNAGRSRGRVDESGQLVWTSVGGMPIGRQEHTFRTVHTGRDGPARTSATALLDSLSHVARRFDESRATDWRTTMAHTPTLPEPREHLTSPVTTNVLKVGHTALGAAREFLSDRGFVELLPPVIGPVTDPGARGAKQVDIDFYGHRYKLMTSAILYKQAALLGLDRIYMVAPNVRLEPLETSMTDRHLVEFHQLDVEMRGSRDDAMAVLEELVRHVVDRVVTTSAIELDALGRDPDAFRELLDAPFHRMTHATATEDLHRIGHQQSQDAEIDWAGEKLLSTKATRPFFVTDYPKGSRGFYDRESPTEPGVLRNFDLIAPEGYGELVSGSEREFEYGRIVARIRETGENPAKYGWYLRMLRDGIPASAGFGLGIQRLVRYLTGVDSVWQATAFPKLPGVVSA